MTEWRLGNTELQADLDRGVPIVRTKDNIVGAPTGASDDDVIKTMVKGKLQADSQVSKASIDVDASKGEVTLKGNADSADIVGRAIALALDTQGVTKVSSDVKVSGASDKAGASSSSKSDTSSPASTSSESLSPTGRSSSDTGSSSSKSGSDQGSSSSSSSGSSTGASSSSSSDTTGAGSSASSTKKDNPNN